MSDTPYPAPEVNLPRDGGEMLNLADLRPNGVVLFFYPKANTPGCTKESIGFSEAQAEFKALGYDIVGISMDEVKPWTQGESLLPLINGGSRETPVMMEYAAEGSYAPMVSLRMGKYKYNHCSIDPDQLFDLEDDPNELVNLAKDI